MGNFYNRHKKNSVIKSCYKHPLNSNEKIITIKHDQTEKIKFNVGGEIFEVSKYNIENSKYNSYFKEIIKNRPSENLNDTEIFFDRSPDNFPIILQILRISILIKNLKKSELKEFYVKKLFSSTIKEPEIFFDDLKFYFPIPEIFEEILEDFELKKCLKNDDLNSEIVNYELISNNTDKLFDFMFYRANDLKELENLYCRRAFFFNSGGGLKIFLNKSYKIKKIELRLFVFDENVFKVEECDQISIFTSTDDNNWIHRGEFRLIPNEEKVCTIYLADYKAKYLKINTEKSKIPFSISYFKLN